MLGIISIILVVVFVSGCTDSANTDLTKTFSKQGVSFNYPSDWFVMPYDNGSISTDAQVIGLVGPGTDLNYDLAVEKMPSSTIKQVKDDTMQFDKLNYNATIINETATTVNGLSAYQVLYTEKDPEISDKKQKYSLYLIQKGSAVYTFEFRAYSVDNFDKYTEISNMIMSTVKIS
jgi:hypothetical protein